jgi:RiboL-PSP-HEPN
LDKKKSPDAKGEGIASGGPVGPPETGTSGSAAPTSTVRPLTSFDIFELCVERARNLVKLHEAAHGKPGKPDRYTADAHRAAIVLAISALDAFICDFVTFRTRQLLASKSRPLPPALIAHIKKFLKDDDLLEAARKDDLLERVEKAFRSDFERRSFQGIKNIEEQLRIVGYNDIFHEVAKMAKLNEATLRSDLDRFTQRRHAIAHRGDYNLNEIPPREADITKKDAENCIKLVCQIAKHIFELGSQP